jgi:hypothetical protein
MSKPSRLLVSTHIIEALIEAELLEEFMEGIGRWGNHSAQSKRRFTAEEIHMVSRWGQMVSRHYPMEVLELIRATHQPRHLSYVLVTLA